MKRLLVILLSFAVGSATVGSFSGCSLSSSESLREELANQGPLSLSADDPSSPANLFLAQEVQSSPTVAGFIDNRGTPDAIQISNRSLKPHRVYLFYFDKKEGYLLEEFSTDWIIRGPEEIPERYMQQLAGFPHIGQKAPLSGAPQPQTSEKKVFTQDLDDIPQAEEKRVSTAPSGDIVHKVQYPGETLRLITGWYTGDPENASRVARINGMKNPDLLNLGTSVRIPRYLLERSDPLPPEEIQKYIRRITSNQKS